MHDYPSPLQVAATLRGGELVADRIFDACLPDEYRAVSSQHWTPLHVAVHGARWLRDLPVRTVLDIGSGAGKFCVAAHLAGSFRCVGLEQRLGLVHAARDLAAQYGVEERVTFVHGTLGSVLTPAADAYYMYNPFGENLFEREDRIDDDVELGLARYRRDLYRVDSLLNQARVGTYLLTYNGFGGTVPATYRSVRRFQITHAVIELFQKSGLGGLQRASSPSYDTW